MIKKDGTRFAIHRLAGESFVNLLHRPYPSDEDAGGGSYIIASCFIARTFVYESESFLSSVWYLVIKKNWNFYLTKWTPQFYCFTLFNKWQRSYLLLRNKMFYLGEQRHGRKLFCDKVSWSFIHFSSNIQKFTGVSYRLRHLISQWNLTNRCERNEYPVKERSWFKKHRSCLLPGKDNQWIIYFFFLALRWFFLMNYWATA